MRSISQRSCSRATTGRPTPPAPDAPEPGQASPRDNVVFEAGLFGSALGMRRTFILHANGAKLPSDLLGLTSVRYDPATTAAEMRTINQKLRTAIESEGRIARIEGIWWQFSLTERSAEEPSAVSLLRISRGRDGGFGGGRPRMAGGRHDLSAVSERGDEGEVGPFGRLLLLERRTASGPQRSAARRNGRDPHRGDGSRGRVLDDSIGRSPELNARTSGVYLRADPEDLAILDGDDDQRRIELIAERLERWKSVASS